MTKRCLFIFSESEKYGLHDIIKPLKPVYNGIGWYVEERFEEQVKQFCQQANMKIVEFPLLEESFEDLRRRHKASYFKEKEIKAYLQIENLKRKFEISNLDTAEISSPHSLQALQLSSQGKQLIDLIDEHKRLQEQIKTSDEEERLAKAILNTSSVFNYLLHPTTALQISEELKQTSPGIFFGFKRSF